MTEINIPQYQSPKDSDHFLLAHWRVIAALIVAVIVAVAAFTWYRHMQNQDKLKAENELGVIIVTKTGPERMQALEAFSKTAPSSIKDAVNLEIARTAVGQRDFAKSAEAFNALALTAPEGMRALAAMGQATSLAQAGDKAQAVKMLSDLMPKAPKTFQPVVARQLAAVAEDAKMYKEALAAYERLLEAVSGGNKTYYESKVASLKAQLK